jgi:sugar phosphate isomerase/epimerase
VSLVLGSATYTYLWSVPLEAALDRLAERGFTWVEIMATPPHCWPRTMDRAARRRLRDLFGRLGLRLAALNPTFTDINLASTNSGLRQESILQAKETIELAGDLDARGVVLSFGRRNAIMPAPFDTAWQLSRSAIEECLRSAEEHGVVLYMENNPSHFIRTSHQCVEAARHFGTPNLKLVFDVANASLVEDPAVGLRVAQDYLGYVHLSDTDGVSHSHRAAGAGSIDFAAISRALMEADYQGICALETTDPDDPDGSIRRSVETLLLLGWQLQAVG